MLEMLTWKIKYIIFQDSSFVYIDDFDDSFCVVWISLIYSIYVWTMEIPIRI